jgi:hypothetical protein
MRSWDEGGWGEETRGGINVCDYKIPKPRIFWRSHYCAPVEGGSQLASTKKYFNAARFDSSSKMEEPINFTGRGVYRFLSEKLVNLLGCKLKLPSKDSLFVKQ